MFRSFVLENELVFCTFYKSFIIILRRCESVLITEQNISFFRFETDNENRQYEKDARDIIANGLFALSRLTFAVKYINVAVCRNKYLR